MAEALAEMREDGEVVLGEIVKQAGRRKQTLPAWRLNRPIDALLAQVSRQQLPLAGEAQDDDEDALAAVGEVPAGVDDSAERADVAEHLEIGQGK